MKREPLTIHIDLDWRVLVTLAVLVTAVLLLSLGARAAGADDTGAVPPALGNQVAPAAAVGGRRFYLTNTSYPANQVLSACAAGYHTASIWEILDVSNLTYDAAHPAAKTRGDSGYGPPAYWEGWVRTGYQSSGSATAGTGNCSAWTSTSGAHYGPTVHLPREWETPPGELSVWEVNARSCGGSSSVWCVGD